MRINGLSDCFLLARSIAESDASWFQTLPDIGEYPDKEIIVKGKRVRGTIVVDQLAVDFCLAAFKAEQAKHGPEWKGLLVDREHFSMMSDKPSDAMAWAKDIRGGADGVWTRWDFTPPGKELWDNKIIVSRSPVMDLEPIGGDRYRPVAIKTIAMTNSPQFDTLATFAAARDAAEGTAAPDVAQNKGDTMDKQLCAALGVPETATLQDCLNKIQSMKDAAAASEGDMKKAQAACRKASCEAFIAAHKTQIADEAKFREAYEKNPEATEAAFGVFKASPEKQPSQTRIVARDAKTPKQSAAEDSGASDAKRRTDQHSAIAVCRAANPGMTCREAEAVCRRNDPALFAAEDTAAE